MNYFSMYSYESFRVDNSLNDLFKDVPVLVGSFLPFRSFESNL